MRFGGQLNILRTIIRIPAWPILKFFSYAGFFVIIFGAMMSRFIGWVLGDAPEKQTILEVAKEGYKDYGFHGFQKETS
jgi:vacuolar-type H+-ATPase subunit I/STV1